MRSALVLLACGLWLALAAGGCGRAEKPVAESPNPAPDSASIARVRQVANDLGGDLMGLLLAALDRGGASGAVAFCADSAQARTARHQAHGVYVRRVGTRLRNAANAPDSLEQQILNRFAAELESGRQPAEAVFVFRRPDGAHEVHYARPVLVVERCLACHGDPARLAPAVRRLLAERYPGDQATGYQAGDLRGVISVRLAMD